MLDYACRIWRYAALTFFGRLQVLYAKCLRFGTSALLCIGNKQTLENIWVLLFADHIRALTECFDSKLALISVTRQITALFECWQWSLDAQAKGDRVQKPVETGILPWPMDVSNQLGTFRITLTEVLPWFFSVDRRTPMCNLKTGCVPHYPPQTRCLH